MAFLSCYAPLHRHLHLRLHLHLHKINIKKIKINIKEIKIKKKRTAEESCKGSCKVFFSRIAKNITIQIRNVTIRYTSGCPARDMQPSFFHAQLSLVAFSVDSLPVTAPADFCKRLLVHKLSLITNEGGEGWSEICEVSLQADACVSMLDTPKIDIALSVPGDERVQVRLSQRQLFLLEIASATTPPSPPPPPPPSPPAKPKQKPKQKPKSKLLEDLTLHANVEKPVEVIIESMGTVSIEGCVCNYQPSGVTASIARLAATVEMNKRERTVMVEVKNLQFEQYRDNVDASVGASRRASHRATHFSTFRV